MRVLSRLFRRLFLEMLAEAHAAGRLLFFGALARLADPDAFAQYLAPSRNIEWVASASAPSAGPRPCSPICRAIPTASPSPIAACWPTMETALLSNTRITAPRAAHGKRSCGFQPRVHSPLPHACPANGFHRIRHYGYPQAASALEMLLARASCSPWKIPPLETSALRTSPKPRNASSRSVHAVAVGSVIETFERERGARTPALGQIRIERHDRRRFIVRLATQFPARHRWLARGDESRPSPVQRLSQTQRRRKNITTPFISGISKRSEPPKSCFLDHVERSSAAFGQRPLVPLECHQRAHEDQRLNSPTSW